MGFNIGNVDDMLFESNIFTYNDEFLSGGQIFRFANPSIERSGDVVAKDNIVWNWKSAMYNQTGSYIEKCIWSCELRPGEQSSD